MYRKTEGKFMLNTCQDKVDITRNVDPSDINIANGYSIDVLVKGLDSPVGMLFTEEGDLIVAESGLTYGNARVIKLVDGEIEVIADNFNVPITGISYINGSYYVSHRGFITMITSNGSRSDIITGLPSSGDYFNSRVVLGPDNKMYFGQGTTTNSGVVGHDNEWLLYHPLACDYPSDHIMVFGQNFETQIKYKTSNEIVKTGAFSPYGVANYPNEVKKGILKSSGSILKANLDGSKLELVAWGFRNPSYMEFDNAGRLFVSNNGYEVRGSRPIANAVDEFYYVTPGLWHGWPDFSGGEPITLPRFRPLGADQPEFLIKHHPNTPPKPYVTFPQNSGIRGFDFNYNTEFGPYGDVYIAEFGRSQPRTNGDTMPYSGAGHKLSKIDMNTRTVSTFAINKSGFPASTTSGGGFERPADVVFGPDGAMYVLDLGLNVRNDPSVFINNTGVIWKINKTNS